jgi:hypothetical protein
MLRLFRKKKTKTKTKKENIKKTKWKNKVQFCSLDSVDPNINKNKCDKKNIRLNLVFGFGLIKINQ